MANYQNPTAGQIAATVGAKSGNVETKTAQDGYLFASGVLAPEVSNILGHQFPQYVATAMLERIGSYTGISRDQEEWFEQGRSRKGATITAGGGTTGATITLTLDTDASTIGSGGYFLVKDIIMLESGKTAIVTAIGTSTTFQTITIAKLDGANFIAGDSADSESIGHLSNAHGEASTAPASRLFLPEQRYNQLQTIRRTCTISGKALTDKTYIDNGASWYYKQEMLDMAEMAKDRENAVMFSEISDQATLEPTCEGILPAVARGGVNNVFGTAVVEDDIMNHIKDLLVSGGSGKEYTVFCGAQFLADAQKALKDYYKNGGVNYGTFSSSSTKVGINPETYLFLGITINFVHYATFDDIATLPFAGTPDATKINYSNFSLWLNMGSGTEGEKLVSLKYKELNGQQRKFIYKKENGLAGNTDNVANGTDALSGHMLSEIMPELRNLNMHGTLRANS